LLIPQPFSSDLEPQKKRANQTTNSTLTGVQGMQGAVNPEINAAGACDVMIEAKQ